MLYCCYKQKRSFLIYEEKDKLETYYHLLNKNNEILTVYTCLSYVSPSDLISTSLYNKKVKFKNIFPLYILAVCEGCVL